MRYVTEKTEHGRKEFEVNVQAFARDLAKELGGSVIPQAKDALDRWRVEIKIDQNTKLFVSTSSYMRRLEQAKITVSILATDVKHEERNFHDKAHKTASATVNPDARTVAQIAKDVRKRVIEASETALAVQRLYAEGQRENRSRLVKEADAFKKAFPGFDVRVNEPQQQATLYSSAHGGHYVSATLNGSGDVSLEHIGSMSVEKFKRVLKALNS